MTITGKIATINRLLAEALQEFSGPRGCGRPGEPPYTPEPAIPVLRPITCKVARLSAPGIEHPTLKRTPPELPEVES